MAEKDCEKCRWHADGVCRTYVLVFNGMTVPAEDERNTLSGCGPSGLYWEPKDE